MKREYVLTVMYCAMIQWQFRLDTDLFSINSLEDIDIIYKCQLSKLY